ncbi:MAG: 30S ribosomal protein S1 [Thermoanaerobaculia bacterium]
MSEEAPAADTSQPVLEASTPEDGLDKAAHPAAEAAEPEAPKVPEPPRKSAPPRAPAAALPTAEGTVIGWNDGGFHVVVDGKTGFCPRSEMELSGSQEPKDLVDQTFQFSVLRIERKGKRIVLSRKAFVQGERREAVGKLRGDMEQGEVLSGTVASLTSFGAFIDLGGVQGLLHVSEISRKRVQDPAEVLSEGQEVQVKILKIEKGGRRISLSMKALEPDPWRDAAERFPQGKVVRGTVERTANFGAFVEIAPGLTGLLPTSAMSLPRNTNAARVYHPGKEISVQILQVDPRRRRVSLGLEGSSTEGSRADLDSFRRKQQSETTSFNALAAAFEKARRVESD